MTQPKRYNGNKQHAEAWHGSVRSGAWLAKQNGMGRVNDFLSTTKYEAYAEVRYNASLVAYEIVLEIARRQHHHKLYGFDEGSIQLTHIEDAKVFPSDHLMTKLILLVG